MLVKLESAHESDILEDLQEVMDMVHKDLRVDDEDRTPVTPQMMKEFLAPWPWDRTDLNSLTTGIGSNLLLHVPRDRAKSSEQAELFKAKFFATNAPDAAVLKNLYSDSGGRVIYVPTIQEFRLHYAQYGTLHEGSAAPRPSTPPVPSQGHHQVDRHREELHPCSQWR